MGNDLSNPSERRGTTEDEDVLDLNHDRAVSSAVPLAASAHSVSEVKGGNGDDALTASTNRKSPATTVSVPESEPHPQTNRVLEAFEDAFHEESFGMETGEKEKLLVDVLKKLNEKNMSESLLASTSPSSLRNIDTTTQRSKRPRPCGGSEENSSLGDASTNYCFISASARTLLYPQNTLQGQPVEVLKHIACYLERVCINNLASTCKRVYSIVENEVDKPWPTKCPFSTSYSGTIYRNPADGIHFVHQRRKDNSWPHFFFSSDCSRVAIYREGNYRHNDVGEYKMRILEVWDKDTGLLGEVYCHPRISTRPVFSPDNQLLVYDTLNGCGIRICQLPERRRKDRHIPLATSVHRFGEPNAVCDVRFWDNHSIIYRDIMYDEEVYVWFDIICKRCICRENNQISVSEEASIIYRGETTSVSLAHVSILRGNDILAMIDDESQSFLLYHLGTKSTSSHKLQSRALDVISYPDSMVYVLQEGHVSVVDCSSHIRHVSDIPRPRTFSIPARTQQHISQWESSSYFSWTPTCLKGAGVLIGIGELEFNYFNDVAPAKNLIRMCIYDIGKKKMSSFRWKDDVWKEFIIY